MALIANNVRLDVERNYSYEFTITSVEGQGYATVADAKKSIASNTALNYQVLVQDNSGYELQANNEYYPMIDSDTPNPNYWLQRSFRIQPTQMYGHRNMVGTFPAVYPPRRYMPAPFVVSEIKPQKDDRNSTNRRN